MVVGLVILAVPATVFAYNTYVGLKIESVNNPNVGSPTEWCLVKDLTTMTIKFGADVLDTVTTSSDICPGGTIWSNLVNLTSGNVYTLDLSTQGCGADGYYALGYCWFYGSNGQNCTSVCSGHGYTSCTMGTTHANDTSSCDVAKHFTTCTCGSYGSDMGGPFTGSGGAMCYYITADPSTFNCSDSYCSHARLCTCDIPLTYTFSFTAPAE